MKFTLKSVPGLADVGVLHGVEDGPRTVAQGSGGVRTKFQTSNFSFPIRNNKQLGNNLRHCQQYPSFASYSPRIAGRSLSDGTSYGRRSCHSGRRLESKV